MKKRLLNMGMSIALCLSILPTTAFAAPAEIETAPRKSMMIRMDNLLDPITHEASNEEGQSGSYYTPSDYIYFGKYEQDGNVDNGAEPIKWQLLNIERNTQGHIVDNYLVSEYLLSSFEFYGDSEDRRPEEINLWDGSSPQSWCRDFAGESNTGKSPAAFSIAERNAVDVRSGEWGPGMGIGKYTPKEKLNNDRVFLPSATDIAKYFSTYSGAPNLLAYYPGKTEPATWWTRTAWIPLTPYGAEGMMQVITKDGLFDWANPTCDPFGARPAMHLDVGGSNADPVASPVVLTTAAVQGKNSGVDGLKPLTNYDGNEWKVTVTDDARSSFSVTVNLDKTISYANAKTGPNEYLSAIVVENGTNELTHYGHILKLDTDDKASGTVSIDTVGLSMKGRTLYVFNEKCNGDYETDYSSKLQEVRLGSEQDYIYTATAVQGQIGPCEYVDGASEYINGRWDTSVLTEKGLKIFVNPESAPEGTILTGVKSVTSTGRDLGNWLWAAYRNKEGHLLQSFYQYMPDDDVTVTPIFDRVIMDADVQMITPPQVGETTATTRVILPQNAQYTVDVRWIKNGMDVKPEEVFDLNQDYEASVYINAKEGYAFQGFSQVDPIPENEKSRISFNGQTVIESEQVKPGQPVCGYVNYHTIHMTVSFPSISHELRFDANGMQGTAPEALTYAGHDYNKSFTIPGSGDLTDTDASFISWNTQPDGSGTTYLPGDTFTFGKAEDTTVTLYAQKGVHTHSSTKVNGKAATCTDDGWKDYYKCDCGKFFEDEACTKEITNLDTWKSGEGKLDKLPHTYGEWIVVTPATETSEGLEKRICSVCKHEETRVIDKLEPTHKATVEGLSLSLADKIGVNYYLNISKDILADEAAYVEFTREDNTTEKFLMSEVKEKATVVNGNTLYCLSVPMAARQMTDAINGKVVLSNGDTIVLTQTSVQNYAKVILDNKDHAYSTEAINAVKAMLNYGAAAQVQFDNKVETLANAILSKEDQVVNVDNSVFDQYQASKEGSVAGIEYFGTSVLLKSETGFAHYFTLEENANIEDYTFTVNGQPVEVASREGKYYVEVNNIYAKDLANSYVVEVSKGEEKMTIAFGVFGYANVVVNGEYSEELQSVVRSMYPYYEAALAYSESVTKK